jgi:hypothetical protein
MSHNQEGRIKDVFEDNLEEELRKISDLLEDYNFISMVSKILKNNFFSPSIGHRIPRDSFPFKPKQSIHQPTHREFSLQLKFLFKRGNQVLLHRCKLQEYKTQRG